MSKFGFNTAEVKLTLVSNTQEPPPFISFTVFHNLGCSEASRLSKSWPEVCEMLRAPDVIPRGKLSAPLLKMATFGEERNPDDAQPDFDKRSLRYTENLLTITGVEADYDEGEMTMEEAAHLLEKAGVRAVLYSSWGDGLVEPPKYLGGPRWRIIAPLSEPASPVARSKMVARINGALGGVLADESFVLAQGFFIGARPGGDYKCKVTFQDPSGGQCVDKLTELDQIAIYKRNASQDDSPDERYGVKIKPGSLAVAPQVYSDLRTALSVIPADRPYLDWWRILRGISRLSDTYQAKALAREWSTSSDDPTHTASAFEEKWRAVMREDSVISYQTIFYEARQCNPEWDKDLPAKPPSPTMWEQVDLSNLNLEPVDYLIDDFLARALMVFVGKPGMGKSTAMVAIAVVVAGFEIPGSPLRSPVKGRKIVYITEDIDQFKRNLIALNRNFGFPLEHLASAFVLLPAHRVKAEELLGLRQIINNSTRTHADSGVLLRPWLVFDTTSASFHLEDENSNAEVAAVLALLKAEFYEKMQCPVCMVAHSHKHSTRQDFVADPRGAGAWAGDTTLTSGIFEEDDNRFIMLGKRRYSPLHTELRVDLHKQYDTVRDLYGRVQTVELDAVSFDWSSTADRVEARESAKDASKLKKSQLIQSQMYLLIEAHPMHGANYYIDMTLEQGGPGHSKPLKKKAIEELIASGQVDLVEPEKKGRAGNVLLVDPVRHAEIVGRYGI